MGGNVLAVRVSEVLRGPSLRWEWRQELATTTAGAGASAMQLQLQLQLQLQEQNRLLCCAAEFTRKGAL